MTDLFISGLVMHLIGDFFLQSEWMSDNKTSLQHPASWIHSGIHFALLLSVFPLLVAVPLAISHLLIDTRVPLQWWRRFYGQTTSGPAMLAFGMWQDQAAHLICLAVAAAWCAW